jgi:hypothetical protein
LKAISAHLGTRQLYAFARCPKIILVVVRAIAVPVIRDGEGGVLKHPVLSVRRSKRSYLGYGKSPYLRSSVYASRAPRAGYRVALACPLATTGVESPIRVDLVGIAENLPILGEEMGQWNSPYPRENANNCQNT